MNVHNSFNEQSCKAMLWTVHHWWLNSSRFTFNCYRHAAQLILWQPHSKPCSILLSREGITQEDLLAMVLYVTPMVEAIHSNAN
jgi:hypothetical protein